MGLSKVITPRSAAIVIGTTIFNVVVLLWITWDEQRDWRVYSFVVRMAMLSLGLGLLVSHLCQREFEYRNRRGGERQRGGTRDEGETSGG